MMMMMKNLYSGYVIVYIHCCVYVVYVPVGCMWGDVNDCVI